MPPKCLFAGDPRNGSRLPGPLPALSRTLRQLEDRAGAPPAGRSATGLTLLPEGTTFPPEGRAALGASDDAPEERPTGRTLRPAARHRGGAGGDR
ncbi:hypothetical protein Aab01nite_61640 [Paractinoplanes abujensis]|nr:hypothetical protein Aab01nite_61640 [Actinoplanes abujensis]